MATLRERIGDAPRPDLPADRDGIHWRAGRPDDVDAVAGLAVATAAVDHPDWAETREEIADAFGRSTVDPARDSIAAESDGRLVAHGWVRMPRDAETVALVDVDGGVHPEFRGRGIGRELLAWQVAQGRHRLAALEVELPGWVMLHTEERNLPAQHLAQRAGLPARRWFSKLERDLAEPIDAPDLPAGLRLAAPDPADSEPTRQARNASFRDHWGSQPTSAEAWSGWWTMSTFAPTLSALAWDGDVVAGFVLTWLTPEDFERQGWVGGYIGLVGTLREWRGQGVAAALLGHTLLRSAEAGHERIALDVDSENPTGALGLYTRLGFRPHSRSVAHVLEL